MTRPRGNKGPDMLTDLAQQVEASLRELVNMEQDRSEQVGQEVANRMAALWGGQLIYFPLGMKFKLTARDRKIWEEFSGHNQADLARKFGVSLQWIYKIIKAMRKEEQERLQRGLFGSPEGEH